MDDTIQSPHQTDICIYSSLSSNRFLDSDVIFRTSSERPAQHGHIACHRSLIYLLGMVQALEMDFLPVTWQPENGLIGRGATSEIHHASLGQGLSLAFKSINVRSVSQSRTDEEQEAIISLMMAEIQHMDKQPLRESPYVHHVEGICWSPSRGARTVDPVIVYEKALHGDLHSFMTTGPGQSMSFLDRIQVCRDVGRGLERLHFCKILHGDVKPQNVLMMDFNGQIVPKVADFGFSVTYTDGDAPVYVSRTVPWHAPELAKQKRELTYRDAIRTDIYSFGLLCLWMLFSKEVSEEFHLGPDFADRKSRSQNGAFATFDTIEDLKSKDLLLPACKKLVNLLDTQCGRKDCVARLFEKTLSANSVNRVDDFQSLLRDLNDNLVEEGRQEVTTYHLEEPVQSTQGLHYQFEIAESLAQLIQADVRVGEHLARSLLEQAQTPDCERCRRNAAFQAAICFTIGFGVPADESSAHGYLNMSGKSTDDLEQEIRSLSHWNDPFLYHTNFLNNIHNEGYLRDLFMDVDLSVTSLDTTRIRYQEISQDLAASLGAGSSISSTFNLIYAKFLKNIGNYDEAAVIEQNCLFHLETSRGLGIDNLDVQNAMYALADTYRSQGKFEEAERCNGKVLTGRTKLFGTEHPLTLICLHFEAQLLREREQHVEAEKRYKTLIPQLRSTLGETHPGTLNAMTGLATLLIDMDRTKEAFDLLKDDVDSNERTLGPYNYTTLVSLNNLAGLYSEQGNLTEAKTLFDQLAFRFRQTLGEDHVTTCLVLSNQASIYHGLGEYDKSIPIYDKVISRLESLSGPESPRVLEMIRSKAVTMSKMGMDHDEVAIEAMFQRCLAGLRKLYGNLHREVLLTLQEYSFFLFDHERFEEAETSFRTLLSDQETALGKGHESTVVPLFSLGQVLEEVENPEAADMYRRAVAVASKKDGGTSEYSWGFMEHLAFHLCKLDGNLEEAESIFRGILSSKRTTVQDPYELGGELENLKEVLIESGKLGEAEEVQEEIVGIWRRKRESHEVTSDDLLDKLGMLAWIRDHSGKFPEAQEVYAECVAVSTSVYREDGERTLDFEAKMAWSVELAGRSDEAKLRVMDALRRSKERYGVASPAFLDVAARAAAIYFRQGDRATAVYLSQGILENVREVFGDEDEEKIRVAEANHATYTSAR